LCLKSGALFIIHQIKLSSVNPESNKAVFDRATRVTRRPIEHPRSLAHATLLDLDKQGDSSRPLPEGIAVWRELTRVADVISSDTQYGA